MEANRAGNASHRFGLISTSAARWAGHGLSVAATLVAVLAWLVYGAAIGFPDEWLIVSKLAGTLVTVLVLLLVQHARSRHILAIQAKVDQLIYASEAGNHWIGTERHPPEFVEQMCIKHHSGR